MEIVSYAMGEGAGYTEGYQAGYQEGTASTESYQEGYTAGEAAGYTTGYSAGVASVNSVKGLIGVRGAARLFDVFNNSSLLIDSDAALSSILKYDDTAGVTDMSYMFAGQNNISKDMPLLNTDSVTNMSYMFSFVQGAGIPFRVGIGTIKPPLFNTSNVTNITGMFCGKAAALSQNRITELPLYDFRKVTFAQNFIKYCSSLVEIPAFDFAAMTNSNKAFKNAEWLTGCSALTAIHIVDIHYDFNISSVVFTRSALLEIISNLRDLSDVAAQTLTLGSTNIAKLTEDDIAVATDKNWTVA